jgi:hypothetical protein
MDIAEPTVPKSTIDNEDPKRTQRTILSELPILAM